MCIRDRPMLGATSGHSRWAAVLKPLICLTTGGSQKDIVELFLPDILLSCSFRDSKASLAKQRNSCYSGKRTQNDSPATSVITPPPVTNKLFQSYYSILGTHCLYDSMTAWYYFRYGDTFSSMCNNTYVFCHKIFICRPTTNIKSNFERHFL